MKNKILIISQYYTPDITAAAFRIRDMYLGFSRAGLDATIITTHPHKGTGSNEPNTQQEQEADIHRLHVKTIKKKSLLAYLYNYFGFVLQACIYALLRLRKKRFDYVLITSPPLFVAMSGYVLAKWFRAEFIVEIRDIWPDSAVAAGMIRKDGLLYRMTHRLEKFMYRKADRIICVAQYMKQYIANYTEANKITILYNGISESDAVMLDRTRALNGLSENRVFRVMYAGNIGIVQGMDVLVDALKHLEEKGLRNIEVTLIGDGIEKRRLQERIESLQLSDWIKFTGPLPKEKAIMQLLEADCLFLHLIKDEALEKTIPSKLFDYLLMNKPIVYGIGGEGFTILNELDIGCAFQQEDAESLAEAIGVMYRNKEAFLLKSAFNRDYVMREFNRTEQFDQYGRHLLGKSGEKELQPALHQVG